MCEIPSNNWIYLEMGHPEKPKVTITCLGFALFRASSTFRSIQANQLLIWIDISSVLEGWGWGFPWALAVFESHKLSQYKISSENFDNK